LTSDKNLGEKVLKAALEQCLKGADCVFREWMLSWARRLIIKACAEIMQPGTLVFPEGFYFLPHRLNALDLEGALSMSLELLQEKLLKLDPLQRFVFVLRAMEGYSRRDTALLLNIEDRLCEWTYMRAAEAIAEDFSAAQLPNAGVTCVAESYTAQAGD
jgi:DNA-directed RNA polymerase specialized sigma24 family protein